MLYSIYFTFIPTKNHFVSNFFFHLQCYIFLMYCILYKAFDKILLRLHFKLQKWNAVTYIYNTLMCNFTWKTLNMCQSVYRQFVTLNFFRDEEEGGERE